jgi:hypothetical protein
MPLNLGVVNAKVKLVPDEQYLTVVHSLIVNAERVCLCNEFIIDVSPVRDPDLMVYSVLLDLCAQHGEELMPEL